MNVWAYTVNLLQIWNKLLYHDAYTLLRSTCHQDPVLTCHTSPLAGVTGGTFVFCKQFCFKIFLHHHHVSSARLVLLLIEAHSVCVSLCFPPHFLLTQWADWIHAGQEGRRRRFWFPYARTQSAHCGVRNCSRLCHPTTQILQPWVAQRCVCVASVRSWGAQSSFLMKVLGLH